MQLSVIVPAHNGAATLPRVLSALRTSELQSVSWELIVVDDASTDNTASVATTYADTVVTLDGAPHGPAHARNRGVEHATGQVLAFVDADVVVHADALRRMLATLETDSSIGAVFGAYDDRPESPARLSQYRNLVHRYVHVANAGDAETFWAGCGAIRRSVFVSAGGFDEHRYPRPQIEDIELGHRIRDHGARIVIDPAVSCTHLKHWTLRGIVVTDFRDRALPWVELLLAERRSKRHSTLNVRGSEKVFVACTVASLATFALWPLTGDLRLLFTSLSLLGVVIAGNLPLLRWLNDRGGLLLVLVAIPMRFLHYASSGLAVLVGMCRYLRGTRASPGAQLNPAKSIALQRNGAQLR